MSESGQGGVPTKQLTRSPLLFPKHQSITSEGLHKGHVVALAMRELRDMGRDLNREEPVSWRQWLVQGVQSSEMWNLEKFFGSKTLGHFVKVLFICGFKKFLWAKSVSVLRGCPQDPLPAGFPGAMKAFKKIFCH